jgi:Tol biopolymer transport system component
MLSLLLAAAALSPLAAAQAQRISPEAAGNCQAPNWSPDGNQLSWEVNFHDRKIIELYVSPGYPGAAPRRVVPVTRGSSAMTAGFDVAGSETVAHELSWAPAALKRFVYSSSGATQDYDLYIEGGGPVAPAPGADGTAAWSPDGKWIVFTSARTGQGDLYLIDVAAVEKPPLKLTGDSTASELFAAWSPDSKQVAFVGHTQKGDNIYLIDNVAFPAPRPVTAWEHAQTRPTWSPDGTMIAFFSNHNDIKRFDLYVTPVTGTPTLVATDVAMNDDGPAWTPDSKHLLYVKKDETQFDPIYAAPVRQPSQARLVATGTVGNGDLDVVKRLDGKVWITMVAQGLVNDKVRDFKRVYAMVLPGLP